MGIEFKSNYLLRAFRGDANVFTPNILRVDDNGLTFIKRNHFLINVDQKFMPFSGIATVNLNAGLVGASLVITSKGGDLIQVTGLSMRDARMARDMITNRL